MRCSHVGLHLNRQGCVQQLQLPTYADDVALPAPALLCAVPQSIDISCQQHWRQPRRGCRGHIPQYFGWGDVNGNIPQILLRTFGYSRPILVALRSLSLKPISFGYKTPLIRVFSSHTPPHSVVRPPNLELALTPLASSKLCTARRTDDSLQFYRPFCILRRQCQ